MNYRHGDLSLLGVKNVPNGLKVSKSKVLMVGSQNNSHTFDNGAFYPKIDGQFIIGYLEAKNTKLLHLDHGKIVVGKKLREAKINNGVYQLRRQVEDTHAGMKPVID